MYKVAILGCENSHANMFLRLIKNIDDIEVVGIFSEFQEAAEKLNAKFGAPIMKSYDELVGQLDGLIITARHGKNHYKYAKPYLDSKIPLFIDKPMTICEHEAVEFMNILKNNNIPSCGGSMVMYADHILSLKEMIARGEHGKVIGAYLRAPLHSDSEHGGFYFYAQHLVQVICELFGYYPNTVHAFKKNDTITVITRYDDYDITGVYYDTDPAIYYAGVNFEKTYVGQVYPLDNAGEREFETFHTILKGGEQHLSYEELFAPVFIMNAIERSLESGKEEPVHRSNEVNA